MTDKKEPREEYPENEDLPAENGQVDDADANESEAEGQTSEKAKGFGIEGLDEGNPVEDNGKDSVADKTNEKSSKEKKEPGFFEQMEMREPKKKESAKKDKGDKKTAGEYLGEVVTETKRVTWPTRPEILKWSLVVLAALVFFTLFTFIVDTFVAGPITYGISGFASGEGFGRKAIILSVLFVLTGLGSAAGVMLHAGGDQNGLSDGLSATLTGGSAVAEKNLDRLTIVMIVLFTLTAVAMMIWFPLGTMGN